MNFTYEFQLWISGLHHSTILPESLIASATCEYNYKLSSMQQKVHLRLIPVYRSSVYHAVTAADGA